MLLPFPLFLKGKITFVVAWRRLKLMDKDRFWCASMIFTRDIHILYMHSYLFLMVNGTEFCGYAEDTTLYSCNNVDRDIIQKISGIALD